MNNLDEVISHHFREFIAAHCPKLKYDRFIWSHTVFSPIGTQTAGTVGVDVGWNPYNLERILMAGFKIERQLGFHRYMDVPISDPDSLERVERFLLECHNQLL